ncbi:hypothetical protein ScPMuIL_014424 [Solemya velum]
MDQFKAPENLVFAGNLHENWRRWEQKLGLYLLASGNNEKDDRTKVAILLHCAGDEAIEIFNNFEFPLKDNGDPDPDDNPDKFEAVLAQFRAYCNPRKNTVIERYNFWMCSQRDGETFDQFVTELRTRAKNCEFGTQTDPMIRDRIIFGINDDRLRERLLRDSADPALSRVIELCRAAEASKKQLQSLQTQSQVPVDSVRVKSTPRGAQKYSETQKTQRHSEHTRPKERIDCKYCGYTHLPRRCPAYGKKCGSCHRKNHFAKMCPSLPKNVSAIHACDSDESDYDLEVDTLFIGELSSDQTRTNKAWFATLGVNGHDVSFKLDTECEQNTRFVQHRKRRRSLKFEELLSLTGYRIRFDECNHPSSVFPAIQYDGTPFVILNTEVYECHQGPQRAKHLKKRETAVDEDHSYLSSGKKRCYQTSKKRNCPAKIRVKRILKFPEYKIIGQPTARKKRQVSQQLKAEFSIQTRREPVTYVHIDSVDDHQYHLTGELAGFTQPIDKRVICQIKQLALEGHRNVSSVRILLKELAKELAPEAPENNRRFFPTNDDIRTHIYQTIVGSNLRSAQEDQANVRKLLETPGKFAEELKYLFRPASSDGEVINSLLLVIQTRFQQTLMAKYGAVTLMDATYKTTKYEIPLYNLCVQTNVGFFIVASFFLSADTTTCIAEALEVIKGWNPSWHPENFMCDFDMREIGALQSIFKDAPALLCDFHRITAWRKWLNSSDVPNKNDVLKQLQEIASAETELNYRCLLQKLKNSTTYKENEKLKNWFERKWLKEETRWAFCFRKDIFNIISTTNGIETQYKTLKHFYLKEFGIGKSLANVLEVLLDKFFPDSQLSYRRENIKSFEESRNYSPEVPAFLRNRPRKFMRHCLDRLPPNVNEIKKEDIQHCGEFLKVKSQDSNSVYEIKLQDNMPSCSCKDFMVRNWPCKHFLAVYKLFEFNCLESYMGRLLFVLDKDVMKNEDNENTFELPIHKEEEKEEDQILDTEKIRKRSVALLSQIENYLYASQEKEVLEKAVQTLEELSTFLNNKIPKMDGLPLRKNAYFHLLSVKAENRVLHVDCVVITAIFTGHIQRSGLLQNEKLEDYEAILGAVNEGGNHWTLVIIHPKERTILYLNPLGETHISNKRCCRTGSNRDLVTSITQHAKQADGIYHVGYVIQRKSSIFIYEPVMKKTREKHCICQKKNDGKIYWQCGECTNGFTLLVWGYFWRKNQIHSCATFVRKQGWWKGSEGVRKKQYW